jgi:hypothetical protein
MSINTRADLILYIDPAVFNTLTKEDLTQYFTDGVYINLNLLYPREILEGKTFAESLNALLSEFGAFKLQKEIKENEALTSSYYDRINEKFSHWHEPLLLELMEHLVSLGYGCYLIYTGSGRIDGQIKEYTAVKGSHKAEIKVLTPVEEGRLNELNKKEEEFFIYTIIIR